VKLRSILHFNGLPMDAQSVTDELVTRRASSKWQQRLQHRPVGPKVNRIGLQVLDYRGGKTTLCAGCGHNAISERIIDAMYEMGVQPERVMKLSGIGCSSKSPAYFMSRSHSFNSVHGRMPSVSTGAMLGNHTMKALGVSGDGDTASIGMGQFVHLLRRNLPMIYIIEDNGVYGLTKGQFSATADLGSKLKTGVINDLPPIDTCSLAIQLGATFVGRSFSGDKKQLLAMLKAAIAHKGTVMLDVISPCVTFNDHEGSTKSYKYMQEHDEPINELALCPASKTSRSSTIPARRSMWRCTMAPACACASCAKTTTRPTRSSVKTLMEAHEKGEVLTGVFYVDTRSRALPICSIWSISRLHWHIQSISISEGFDRVRAGADVSNPGVLGCR
jgi:2-oxoglutarate ferredoxin oxidoreductase subunit beta